MKYHAVVEKAEIDLNILTWTVRQNILEGKARSEDCDDTVLFMHVSRSVTSDSATPQNVVHQAPLSVGFSRQEHWSGSLFPSPGDLPDPGIEPGSPALQADSLPSEPAGKLCYTSIYDK